MNNKMTNVEVFTKALSGDLEKFTEFWKKHQETNPDIFPEKMVDGEWFEQFMFFLENETHKTDVEL